MASHDGFANYSDTARALASQISDDDEPTLPDSRSRSSTEPAWQRRPPRPQDHQQPRWRRKAETVQRRATELWHNLTPYQRAGLVIFNIVLLIAVILGLTYTERISALLTPAAKRWRELPAGWLILWFLTFFVSFPPMIGYSTCVTIAGFVFGMKGWFIMSTATVAGSTCAFLVSRTVLKTFVSRLTEKNQRFAALSLVLKHDGLKLLIMIRICPLPYSLSNGAISTIPSVTWYNFMIATAVASPKLLLHIFVGSRLGDLAENGDKMDFKTKLVSYASILFGIVAGFTTGYWVYARTQARAKQLEAEDAASAVPDGHARTPVGGGEYIDDPDEHGAPNALRRDDDVSLHTTYDDDLEAARGYRDDFTDDEDAQERDVFAEGDGDELEDPWKRSGER